MLGSGISLIWCHFYSCLLSNWLFAEKFSNCSNSLNFEAKINCNTIKPNVPKWRKTCTGIKFDLLHFYVSQSHLLSGGNLWGPCIKQIEVWPFVPVAKDLKDLLKPVGGHWSLIWDKTHHWGDSFFLVHCQPLTNRKAVQGTLNCFPICQLVVPDLTISTQISNLFSHL